MNNQELQFTEDGQIKLDAETQCGALCAEMDNGNKLELFAYYEGKVWLVVNTLKQEDGTEKQTITAYSMESMMALLTMFPAIMQTIEKQKNGGLILPENKGEIIAP